MTRAKKNRRTAFVLTSSIALLVWFMASAAPRSQRGGAGVEMVDGFPAVAGEVLVLFPPNAAAAVTQAVQLVDADASDQIGGAGWRRLHSRSQTTSAMLSTLRSRPGIVSLVEPNYIVHTTAVPNDPDFPLLWGLNNTTTPGADIHAVNAWNVSTGSVATVVGVVDTGFDYTHPDLAPNAWSAPGPVAVTIGGHQITCLAGTHGFRSINGVLSCDPRDDNNPGHGTHTSGTIGAAGNNSLGVVGVNWVTKIMGLKFLDSTGSGSDADAVNVIEYAVQAQALLGSAANVRVLSNSWGGGGFSQALLNEIQRAGSANMLFVAAAGNAGTNNDTAPFYPASYNASNLVAVAATDINDGLASFSDYGPTSVALGAPGVNIISTLPGNTYGYLSGTSMATPHVAGAAALILSSCTLTTAQLKSTILSNVDVIPSLTGKVSTNGRLDIDRAIRSCAPSGGGASAVFAGLDTTTQGTWKGVYGADGYDIVGDTLSNPSYGHVTPSGQLNYTWAASTTDVRALQKALASDRIAATWYGSTFSIDVNLTDGAVHRVGLYVVDWDSTSRSETLEVHDAASNALLDSRAVGGFHAGQYVLWNVQGHVTIRVIQTGAYNAVVSGVFFDTAGNTPPTVTLTQPLNGATYVAPASIPLAATAADSDGIAKVEFYAGTQLIGTVTTAPYTGTWSGVGAGSYAITAKAYDARGAATVSAAANVTVTSASGGASAVFAGLDTTTQGTWKGVYGADGYDIVNDTLSNPSYGLVTPSGQLNYTWVGSTADVRALQKAAAPDRIAATWFGSTFSIDVNLTDGAVHRVGFYVVDWDSTSRSETLEVHDATSNALLDSRAVGGFHAGQYVLWNVQGHVTIRVIQTGAYNAVVSGVFFDTAGNTPPTVTLTQPLNGATYVAPASIPLAATASDNDGIAKVEFYAGTQLIGTVTTAPYTGTWSGVGAGSYPITAKAYDARGAATVSAAANITVTSASGGASAVFVGVDTTTQGTWKGVYGADGYDIVNDTLSNPSYGLVTPSGQLNYTWVGSTADVRALQKAAAPDRIAATWFGSTFSIDVNLTDGAVHRVGLYVVDWDSTSRSETLEVHDATSNALLDSRAVGGFHAGQYVLWNVQGYVTIRVIQTGAYNAVVSGVFFDSP